MQGRGLYHRHGPHLAPLRQPKKETKSDALAPQTFDTKGAEKLRAVQIGVAAGLEMAEAGAKATPFAVQEAAVGDLEGLLRGWPAHRPTPLLQVQQHWQQWQGQQAIHAQQAKEELWYRQPWSKPPELYGINNMYNTHFGNRQIHRTVTWHAGRLAESLRPPVTRAGEEKDALLNSTLYRHPPNERSGLPGFPPPPAFSPHSSLRSHSAASLHLNSAASLHLRGFSREAPPPTPPPPGRVISAASASVLQTPKCHRKMARGPLPVPKGLVRPKGVPRGEEEAEGELPLTAQSLYFTTAPGLSGSMSLPTLLPSRA